MADNYDVIDAHGATITKAAKDIGSGVKADTVVLADTSDGLIEKGTFGAPSADVLSVQGDPTGTPIPTEPHDHYDGYEIVAAGVTDQVMGATGQTGDYLAGVLVFPGTAGCGAVTIKDGSTTLGVFAGGGTTALPSLVPFMIPVGITSKNGAWKISTGTNVTAVGVGKFT